jgi:hypothetical protein
LPYNEETFHHLQIFIQDHAIGLLVVDSLSRFWTVTDENNATEVTHALTPLLNLARATGVCVLLVHHNRKSVGRHGDDIRGSGAIFAAVDLALTLHRNEISNQRILRAFSRYPDTPYELIIALTAGGYHVIGDHYTASREEKRAKIQAALTQIPQLPKEVATTAQVGPQSTRRILNDLVQSLEALRIGSGKKNDPFRFTLPDIPISPSSPEDGPLNETESNTASEGAEVDSPKRISVPRIPIHIGDRPYRLKRNKKGSTNNSRTSIPRVRLID